VAGRPTLADELISIVITCKYMGWTWDEYMRQPKYFLDVVNILRMQEAEEIEHQNKLNK